VAKALLNQSDRTLNSKAFSLVRSLFAARRQASDELRRACVEQISHLRERNAYVFER